MALSLRWLLGGVSRMDTRRRLAERVADQLRAALPDDHIVLARYAPRDRGERVPVVVIGRDRVFVIEPREDEGAIVCYQDHWYRRVGPGVARPFDEAPSLRARRDRDRIRSDLGTGGFLTVPIEPFVLFTRGAPDDVRSSCVPVIAGVDALVRQIVRGMPSEPSTERARAIAHALETNIRLSVV